MMKDIIKDHIRKMMREADEDIDLSDNFLSTFGAYREEVVYRKKLVTIDEFDDICEEIANENE